MATLEITQVMQAAVLCCFGRYGEACISVTALPAHLLKQLHLIFPLLSVRNLLSRLDPLKSRWQACRWQGLGLLGSILLWSNHQGLSAWFCVAHVHALCNLSVARLLRSVAPVLSVLQLEMATPCSQPVVLSGSNAVK